MAVPVTLNSIIYSIPTKGEVNWGSLTNYLVALSTGVLSLNGGTFPLANDVNFGPNFGLLSPYFKSGISGSVPATAGILRLDKTESVEWRNAANTGNLALSVSGDNLYFNGSKLGLASPLTTKGDVYVYSSTDTRLGVGLNGEVLTADSTAPTGLSWQVVDNLAPTTLVTGTTQTATSGGRYALLNVAATTVTLPASPTVDAIVTVIPCNSLTSNIVDPNGQTIMGVAGNMQMDVLYLAMTFQFINSTWQII